MRILGIEFGGWSLKAVEMESRFRRIEVLDLHEVRLPLQNLDPTAAYQKAVAELMARLPSHPEKVVTSLPAAQTALRFLQVPLKQAKKVEQSFKFDLEDNVPFKLDDSVVEHHLYPTKEGHIVFAAIAPRRHIQTYLEWLKNVGVDPDWLTFEGMGLVNLYLASIAQKGAEIPPGPVLLMDVGHVKTNIAVLDQNRLELFRSLNWGGSAITQAIASALGISIEEAEAKKIKELRLDEDFSVETQEMEDMISATGRAFSSFFTELNHNLGGFRSQYKLETSKILLTGGTAKLRGIDEFLAKGIGIPVSFFRPFNTVAFGREVDVSHEMQFGEPLGRALVFGRKSGLLFNFRTGDLAKGTELKGVTTLLKDPDVIKLAGYAGLLAGVLFLGIFILGYLADEEAHRSNEELRKVFSDTFHSVNQKTRNSLLSDPKSLKKFIDQKNNELTQRLKMVSKNRTPMLGLVRAVSESFPPEVKVDVNTLALDDRTLKVEGVLYDGNLDRVTEALKKVASFNHVTLERDGQRFTFKGEVVGR